MNLDSNVSGSASITRQKKEHFVEKNLTNITSGKYTLHFSVSPSTNYNCSISLNSVYINGTDSGKECVCLMYLSYIDEQVNQLQHQLHPLVDIIVRQ